MNKDNIFGLISDAMSISYQRYNIKNSKSNNTSLFEYDREFIQLQPNNRLIGFKLNNIKFNMIACPISRVRYEDSIARPHKKKENDREYLIGETEVTQGLFLSVMGYNPSIFNSGFSGKNKEGIYYNIEYSREDNLLMPVHNINVYEALFFCNKLSSELGFLPYYDIIIHDYFVGYDKLTRVKTATVHLNGGDGFRLPTDLEWHLAAEAGTDNVVSGFDIKNDEEAKNSAWLRYNSNGASHKVAQKKPNEWGIYDMTGNLFEMCQDASSTSDGFEPLLKSSSFITQDLKNQKNNHFQPTKPEDVSNRIGFRLAKYYSCLSETKK